MPDVDLAGQGDGTAAGDSGISLNLALAGAGNAAAGSTALLALQVALAGQAAGAATGPSLLAITLDLRNNPAPGHWLTGTSRGFASATATLTQLPSALGGDVAVKAFARGFARGVAVLSAGVALAARAQAKAITPSAKMGGAVNVRGASRGESSSRGRLLRERLLQAEARGQAAGDGSL